MQNVSAAKLNKLNKFIADREKLALKIDAIRQAARTKANDQIVKFVRKNHGEAGKNSAEFLRGLAKILDTERQITNALKQETASKKVKHSKENEA